jgi:hypothetical protein
MVDRFRQLTRAERASKEYIFAAAVSTDIEFSDSSRKSEETRHPPRGWARMPKNVL